MLNESEKKREGKSRVDAPWFAILYFAGAGAAVTPLALIRNVNQVIGSPTAELKYWLKVFLPKAPSTGASMPKRCSQKRPIRPDKGSIQQHASEMGG